MNQNPITLRELEKILQQEQKQYDLARIVNPYACSTMEVDGDGFRALDTCHQIWGNSHRCSNCFSRRACIQGKVLYKNEILDGKNYSIKSSPYRVVQANGEVRNMVIESIRISELAQEKVNSSVQKNVMQTSSDYLFNQARTGVVHMDQDRRIVFANQEARRMLLRGGEEEAFRLSSILSNWVEALQDQEKPSLLFTQRYEYGQQDYFFDVQLIPFDNDGKRDLFIILHERSREEADEIARMRDLDSLTGLYNENGFMRAMGRELEDNPEREYVHIRLNIRNFTLMKSIFSTRNSDALLQRLGSLFRHMTEETGCACRFHSDEFGAFLAWEYFDQEKFKLDLQRVKEDVDTRNFSLRFQVGISRITDSRMEPEEICDQAAIALRHVHEEGEQISFALYSEEMARKELKDNQLIARFEQAILHDEFQMYLQAQTTSEGKVRGAEALVRWIHPGEGMIGPDRFIPLLEKNNMIYRMDQVIWEKAARQLSEWKGTPFEKLHISVNVSATDINMVNIAELFDRLAVRYDIDPKRLGVEITETTMVRDPELLRRTIEGLHRKGFHVEIDDFGSGYSSLKMLRDLNADVLKIDRDFLKYTAHEQKVRTILSAMIRLANHLNMEVITEGVETQEMVDMLSDMGCALFQGFWFSRPLPVPEFMEKYRNLLA